MTEVQYLLGMVAEECAEIAVRASKAQRFGIGETQPGQSLNNAKRMFEEITDLIAVCDMLSQVSPEYKEASHMGFEVSSKIHAKITKVREYMDYSRQQGQLQPKDSPTEERQVDG